MARLRRPWWWIYGLCAALVLGALAFVSRVALRLECDAQCAADEKVQQDRLRRALWRLDSYLVPILAREGGRAYFEYLPYYPQERSYTRYLSPIEKGDVLSPSPLLRGEPEHARLHFQVDAAGAFTSPQMPEGNLRDLAEATCVSGEAFPQNRSLLERVIALVPLAEVRAAVARAEREEQASFGRLFAPHPLPTVRAEQQLLQSDDVEWNARQKSAYKTKQDARNDAETANQLAQLDDAARAQLETLPPEENVVVGTLVPLWLGDAAAPELFFFRRVTVGGRELLQGVFLDWPGLERALLAEAAELLPGARLEPVRDRIAGGGIEDASSLATIPARLVAPPIAAGLGDVAGGFTLVRGTLALSWGAVLAALAGGSLLLRSSLRLGERRNRFASAVTHELRTPLTTFRLYSEMLADGVVSEPEQKRVYLETLKEQSGRLATLVTDGDAVGQVLFNLVDNACKYARGAADRRIEGVARRAGRTLEIEIADHGPGVPAEVARRVFDPFDRGAKNGDPTPGVGLGLALARGIARDLGGDLVLAPADERGGARFTLRLPLDA
jgi:signal transduction histidine kinase